jgi:hypothetical protein
MELQLIKGVCMRCTRRFYPPFSSALPGLVGCPGNGKEAAVASWRSCLYGSWSSHRASIIE